MSESAVSGLLQPGEVLAGKYRIQRVLGTGGVGVVVAAHHLHLDTTVAIKMLLPEALANTAAVGRFIREARTAVKIQSEHVARVSDVGVLESGAPYMVMEYLEGTDLHVWVEQRGPLPIAQAVDFVLQACVAVADAHVLGIIHRDLKPANLFCVRRSDGELTIKVLDFGISKLTRSGTTTDPALTKTSSIMGTPFYMSPEQMRSSKAVDARTDIWALGVILFELLGGRPPFTAPTAMELAVMISTEPAPPLSDFRPDVPPGLQAVVSRCVEKDPAFRYADVGKLAAALLPFAPPEARRSVDRVQGIIRGSTLQTITAERPGLQESHAASPATLLPFGRTELEATKGRSVAIGLGVFGGTVVAATLVLLLVARSPSVPTEMATSGAPAAAALSPSIPPPPPAASAPASGTGAPEPASASPPSTGAPASPAESSAPSATPKPKPSPPKSPGPSCNPPYSINAAGHRVYKPECN